MPNRVGGCRLPQDEGRLNSEKPIASSLSRRFSDTTETSWACPGSSG